MHVVALGGGHGLAASLQAIRRYASDITAIVSVADDGGSSGRLREALGIPAPGDLRKCLVALGDVDSIWTRLFDYRFDTGELDGHSLGNLIIAGLYGATGDFVVALEEAANLVDAVGTVLPATTVPVVLKAEAAAGPIEGQVNVQNTGRVSAVSLVPPDPPAPRAALDAIAQADQIVIGPGSLFT
ncbi:MAG: YvcK family protein, partial [Actinobacteria bacterium]|nr:YvcK family protein [Actinomycetota bacterium]